MWRKEHRKLLPTKFSKKANVCICSSILVETLCYHIPSIGNGDAAYAARVVTLMVYFRMAYQHLTTQWQHTSIPSEGMELNTCQLMSSMLALQCNETALAKTSSMLIALQYGSAILAKYIATWWWLLKSTK